MYVQHLKKKDWLIEIQLLTLCDNHRTNATKLSCRTHK